MERRIKVITEKMKVNDALFYKMQNEQEVYLKRIGLLASEEVVKLAEEIAVRNAILKTMERNDLSFKAAKGLLQLNYPLACLCSVFKINNFTAEKTIKSLMQRCGKTMLNKGTREPKEFDIGLKTMH